MEAAGAGCKVSGTGLWRGMCLEAGQEQRLLGGAMSRVRLCSVSMGAYLQVVSTGQEKPLPDLGVDARGHWRQHPCAMLHFLEKSPQWLAWHS